MRTAVRALSIAISLAAGSAAAGFLFAGSWVGALISLVWGGMWVSGMLRQIRQKAEEESPEARRPSRPEIPSGAASSALLGYALLALAGVWSNVWPGWLLVGMVATLAGWDLEYFVYRLRYVRDETVISALSGAHLRQLGWVAAAGLLLGSAALILRYNLNFGWAVLVTLAAVYGLTRFIGFFKHVKSE